MNLNRCPINVAGRVKLFTLAPLGLALCFLPQQKAESPVSRSKHSDACRPAALNNFCRVGCPDPPPVQVHRVEPSMQGVRRPLARGIAILELGINLSGEVVSACIVRGLRSDFDRAVVAAALQSRWQIPERKGMERGFVVTVAFCTPNNPDCTPPAMRQPRSLVMINEAVGKATKPWWQFWIR